MADPQAATLTQLRNIQARTGKTIAEPHAVIAATGLAKTGERRALLMAQFKLGYGHANAVVLCVGKPWPALGAATPAAPPVVTDANPLDGIYTGARTGLRPLHEAVLKIGRELGSFEKVSKKSCVSLCRNKQFATVGPASKDAIEIGLNASHLPPDTRLKVQPAGSLCQATTRISSEEELDAALKGWLQQAFDAAA